MPSPSNIAERWESVNVLATHQPTARPASAGTHGNRCPRTSLASDPPNTVTSRATWQAAPGRSRRPNGASRRSASSVAASARARAARTSSASAPAAPFTDGACSSAASPTRRRAAVRSRRARLSRVAHHGARGEPAVGHDGANPGGRLCIVRRIVLERPRDLGLHLAHDGVAGRKLAEPAVRAGALPPGSIGDQGCSDSRC